MTLSFHRSFLPLTADPMRRDETYEEILPCPALRPWLRCFWGSREAFRPAEAHLYRERPVVPDLCADLIIQTDIETGRNTVRMTGIDLAPFYSDIAGERHFTLFAVRFYFWALPCFPIGGPGDGEAAFPGLGRYLDGNGFAEAPFPERIALLERYLPGVLNPFGADPNLWNAIGRLVETGGRQTVADLAGHCAISPRSLERLFRRQIGLTPKQAASLVRYQSLWRAALFCPGFSTLDAVEEFGYFDQSHLLRSFRKYHGAPLGEAVAYARHQAALSRFYNTTPAAL